MPSMNFRRVLLHPRFMQNLYCGFYASMAQAQLLQLLRDMKAMVSKCMASAILCASIEW